VGRSVLVLIGAANESVPISVIESVGKARINTLTL
jgi:hypothetical protein